MLYMHSIFYIVCCSTFNFPFLGFLAGLSMFFYKSTTISMYLFSKLVEVNLIKKGIVPSYELV